MPHGPRANSRSGTSDIHAVIRLQCTNMNIIRQSLFRIGRTFNPNSITAAPKHADSASSHLRPLSSWVMSRTSARPQGVGCGPLQMQAEGSGVFPQLPWQYQQVRTGKRGTEYQPKNIKRKRTHGWIKRISSRGGIEVLLRRMLKGRKSLSH